MTSNKFQVASYELQVNRQEAKRELIEIIFTENRKLISLSKNRQLKTKNLHLKLTTKLIGGLVDWKISQIRNF